VEKESDGFRFTRVRVRAEVGLAEGAIPAKVRQAGELAEQYCLVSRSLACRVDYHLEINVNHQ